MIFQGVNVYRLHVIFSGSTLLKPYGITYVNYHLQLVKRWRFDAVFILYT